jgi:succinate dehydrogenase/fumarate reductase flavoprotein subunit
MITKVAPTDTDVVVIGGGGAGLIAAVTAATHGARVVLLEKGDRIGGTTGLSVGTIMAADPSINKLRGSVIVPKRMPPSFQPWRPRVVSNRIRT